jgi:hypothetical protein
MQRVFYFLFLLVGLGSVCCSDQDQAGETVYISGSKSVNDKCQGLLWVQGSPVPLTDEFSCPNIRGGFLVNDVSLLAGEVLAVGVTADGRGGIWRDGSFSQLPGFSPSDPALPQSIWVTGADVYVAGLNRFRGILWKNGLPDTLRRPIFRPGVETRFAGVDGFGSDLAVAGTVSDLDEDLINAVVWLNGTPTILDTLGAYPYGVGNDVAIHGGVIYVAGTLYDGRPLGMALSRPAVWRNGTLKILASTGVANAICVDNGDVYVAGRELSFPVYWKNEEEAYPLTLPPTYNSGTATDIVVRGNDVYVVGTVSDGQQSFAVYWKNDVMNVLDGTLATALHVQQK